MRGFSGKDHLPLGVSDLGIHFVQVHRASRHSFAIDIEHGAQRTGAFAVARRLDFPHFADGING
ncbi:MAG: hypothetical protein SWC40_08280 [Thermodesulfobacteriota bacterium]|nr:hypothetical protein [Thermodesulfobacteriota bacterium]